MTPYTLHEETDANGRAIIGLRDGMTSFCQVTAPSYAATSFCAALQALAQQLAENIVRDSATRTCLDLTRIPEPLAAVLSACIVRRHRHAALDARIYHEALHILAASKAS
jgi:hypothetical protein